MICHVPRSLSICFPIFFSAPQCPKVVILAGSPSLLLFHLLSLCGRDSAEVDKMKGWQWGGLAVEDHVR